MIKKILIGIAFSPNLKANLFEALRLGNMLKAQVVGEKTEAKNKELKQLLNRMP